jgi:DNA-binding transcriptional regulator YhcF (GntR family)
MATYLRVSYSVQAAIASNVLKPGDAVPSTTALASELSVNAMTVSKAMGEMSMAEIITRYKGKSYCVAEDSPSIVASMAEQNIKNGLEHLANKSKHFGINKGTLVKWLKETESTKGTQNNEQE